jgi:hypothetical protein
MIIKKIILLTIGVVISGCTTTTKLEGTTVYDWNRVVEKDGLLYEKKGVIDKPITGHFAAGTQDGNATAVYMEIEEGKIMNGWCRHPKGRKYTVFDGNGAVIYYDHVTGDPTSSRKVKDGRLEQTKEFETATFEFSPYPKKSWTSSRTAVAVTPIKKNKHEEIYQAEPLPSREFMHPSVDIVQASCKVMHSLGYEGDPLPKEAENPQFQVDSNVGCEPIDAPAIFAQKTIQAARAEAAAQVKTAQDKADTRVAAVEENANNMVAAIKEDATKQIAEYNAASDQRVQQANSRAVTAEREMDIARKEMEEARMVAIDALNRLAEKPLPDPPEASRVSENYHDKTAEPVPIFGYQKKQILIATLMILLIACLGSLLGIVIARANQPRYK